MEIIEKSGDLILAVLDTVSNSLVRYLKIFADFIIKFRFIIGFFIFLIFVIFKVNGSSIGYWNEVFPDSYNQSESREPLVGKYRPVRSDEWLVQTPFYLAQSEDGMPVHNSSLSNDGQNMILNYNAPVKDISIIGKPFNWGYLFLKSDRALSWYWGSKIVGLVLISFEACLIITKGRKYLSLLGSAWITLSPAIQWWFMQHIGDLAFFTLAIFVAFTYYLSESSSKRKKIAMLTLFTSSCIGFVLVIYPPVQVPMAYFLIIMFIATLAQKWCSINLKTFDYVAIAISLIIIMAILAHVFIISFDSLKLSLNTAYPGKRVSVGGGMHLTDLFGYLTNWLIPYRGITFSNNCEVSNYFSFLPIVIILAPYWMYKNKDKDFIGIGLLLSSLLFLIWSFVKFPTFFAHITLLSYVTSGRAIVCVGFFAMLATIWLFSKLQADNLSWKIKSIALILMIAFYYIVLWSNQISSYFGQNWKIFTFVFFSLLTLCFLEKRLKLFFYIGMFGLIIISGAIVNPINIGIGAVTNSQVSHEVKMIQKESPNAKWVGMQQSYNYLPALGVKTFNSVNFSPNLKTWHKLDPSKQFENIYNRYAHVNVEFVNHQTTFQLNQADMFTVFINVNQVKSLGIKYICTISNLDDLNNDNVQFKQVTKADQSGWKIYEVK